MTICDLNTGLSQLTHAFSELRERWTETRQHWHDATSRQFEEQHLGEIPARLELMVAAVQRLAAVLEKAEQECQDESQTG
jgi:hypothetical protein